MQMLVVLVAIVAGGSMALATEAIGQMQAPPPCRPEVAVSRFSVANAGAGENSPGASQKHQSLPNGAHPDGRHQACGATWGSH